MTDYEMAETLTDMGYDVELDTENKTYNQGLLAEMAINEGFKWDDDSDLWNK